MNTILRQETKTDFELVSGIIETAFAGMEKSNHKEHLLVARLRKSNAFIPELSIVAEVDGKITGHILLTKIEVVNSLQSFDSLALAPVSVKPTLQNNGIGSKLILAAHQKAKELGFESIIVLGHPKYYPKFGYKKASDFDITAPFEVTDENFMAIELVRDSLLNVSGEVVYDQAFFE